MKKAVWLSFAISLVVVNLAAWLVEQFTGFYIVVLFRVALILGISVVTAIFVGAFLLVNKFEEEQPLTGQTHNTLQSSSTPEKTPGKSETDE
ncbi:MAG: hypothetical protein JKY98_02720 [Gammaproteobacteria bacterium]|nr:hypothetical protein [Gammaproteobacteria bacterium]